MIPLLVAPLLCETNLFLSHSFHQHTNMLTLTGLFAPRQGQAYREEQRRRRSQFDRGTPGAEHDLGVGPRYRLQDPALEHIHHMHLHYY